LRASTLIVAALALANMRASRSAWTPQELGETMMDSAALPMLLVDDSDISDATKSTKTKPRVPISLDVSSPADILPTSKVTPTKARQSSNLVTSKSAAARAQRGHDNVVEQPNEVRDQCPTLAEKHAPSSNLTLVRSRIFGWLRLAVSVSKPWDLKNYGSLICSQALMMLVWFLCDSTWGDGYGLSPESVAAFERGSLRLAKPISAAAFVFLMVALGHLKIHKHFLGESFRRKSGHEVGIEEYTRKVNRNFAKKIPTTAWISNSECVKFSHKVPTKFSMPTSHTGKFMISKRLAIYGSSVLMAFAGDYDAFMGGDHWSTAALLYSSMLVNWAELLYPLAHLREWRMLALVFSWLTFAVVDSGDDGLWRWRVDTETGFPILGLSRPSILLYSLVVIHLGIYFRGPPEKEVFAHWLASMPFWQFTTLPWPAMYVWPGTGR
jgi:hypothetical protein